MKLCIKILNYIKIENLKKIDNYRLQHIKYPLRKWNFHVLSSFELQLFNIVSSFQLITNSSLYLSIQQHPKYYSFIQIHTWRNVAVMKDYQIFNAIILKRRKLSKKSWGMKWTLFNKFFNFSCEFFSVCIRMWDLFSKYT